MKIHLMALSLGILGTVVFVPPAQSQRFASTPVIHPGAAVWRGGAERGSFHGSRSRRYFPGSGFAPYYDSDLGYPDYDYSDYSTPPVIEAPPSQVVVVPTQPTYPAPVPNQREGPLLLELRGDHWERIRLDGPPQVVGQTVQPGPERLSNLRSAAPGAAPRRIQAANPPGELPPAVLVFRDGHKEDIGKYVIKGGTIYIRADYWSSGSWTRQVQIAALDVPATLKLNQERGVNFRLPSEPNVVMIGP